MTFEKLMANSSFLAKLSEAQTMCELQELFESRGVTVTEDQLMEAVLPSWMNSTERRWTASLAEAE